MHWHQLFLSSNVVFYELIEGLTLDRRSEMHFTSERFCKICYVCAIAVMLKTHEYNLASYIYRSWYPVTVFTYQYYCEFPVLVIVHILLLFTQH